MANIHHNREKHPDFIPPTRGRLVKTGKPYVIENVYGSPLKGWLMLCGTMFDLPIMKHRYFELNFNMPLFAPRVCNHSSVLHLYNGGEAARRERVKLVNAMGIDWMPTRQLLREAIPPAYTEYIGKYLMATIK